MMTYHRVFCVVWTDDGVGGISFSVWLSEWEYD